MDEVFEAPIDASETASNAPEHTPARKKGRPLGKKDTQPRKRRSPVAREEAKPDVKRERSESPKQLQSAYSRRLALYDSWF